MSSFSKQWIDCMRGNGFPVVDVETVEEAIDFVDRLHSAWEKAGGDEKVTIGALIAAGALVGFDKAALAVLAEVATAVALAYLGACIGCLGSVAFDRLKQLFAEGKVPGFIVAELDDRGVDITAKA